MKTKHVWITQYALSRGIEEYQCIAVNESGDAMVPGLYAGYTRFVRAVHIHFSLADAQKRTEELRVAKVKNLRNQADRLESKQIKVVQR